MLAIAGLVRAHWPVKVISVAADTGTVVSADSVLSSSPQPAARVSMASAQAAPATFNRERERWV
jgi:hypothetical protein